MKKIALAALLISTLSLVIAAAAACAADFPLRKIDVVVPFGPGSGTDTTMRALAPSLQKVLGVPVVVLNQEGSGGLRGMEYAAKQPADGYTLFLHTPTHILSEVQNLSSVSLTNNFDPVVCLVQDSVLVVASAKGRFKDWSETAAYANEHPGEVTVAGMSPKGIDAISMRMIVKAAGVDITFVPFGSGAEVNSAILGGHVDLGNQGPAETLEMVKGGEMKAFLVANDKRLPAFPDTPTTYDMGLQVTTGPWRALAAPKGTPPEIIAKLEDAIKKAYESEEFQKWLKDVMLDQRPGWKDSKGLGELWKNDLEFFKNAFKELNL